MSNAQTWAYKARDPQGKIVKGRLDAASEASAVARMRAMGLAPVQLAEAGTGTGLNRDLSIGGLFDEKVKLKDLAVMTRQLSTMVGAGLSLLRALNILADQTENKTLAKALGEVCNSVESGDSLSDSLAKHPRIFPPLMIHLVRSGETGGFLDKSLLSIASTFEADVKLRGTIKSAMTYPVVVLMISLLAVVAMLTFIVPIFEQMFADLGGDLPVPTLILVAISKQMWWIAPALIAGVVAFSIWWARNKHQESVRKVVDPWKLKLPVFGPLFTKVAIARFARNFATMTASGVPILQALGIVGETSGNWVIENALHKVQDAVRSGKSIAAPLAQEPVFPSMVTQMIAVGEDSGALEAMLDKIADFYEAEVQSTTEQLTALIEPLLIAFLGIVVGGMVVALYLPVFTIFDQIQ